MRSEQRIISVFIVLQTAQHILVSGNLCSSLIFINCEVKDSLTTYQDPAAHRAHVLHIFCLSQSFSNTRRAPFMHKKPLELMIDRFLTRSPHCLFSWLLLIAGQGIYLRVKRKREWKPCKVCQLKCNFQKKPQQFILPHSCYYSVILLQVERRGLWKGPLHQNTSHKVRRNYWAVNKDQFLIRARSVRRH